MKKQLVIVGIAVLLLTIGLSGCIEQFQNDDETSEVIEPGFEWFQTGNTQPITQLQTKQSIELENNRIGIICGGLWSPECEELDYQGKLNELVNLGIKRFRTSINRWDWANVCWDKPENSINPSHDDFITDLAGNGVTITYNLIFWDKENMGGAENLVHVEVGDVEAYIPEGAQYPRFKTEEEIQRYLDFVQFIVHHFKDRIQIFAIWNEPDIGDCPNWIEVPDYINLVKRAVPVIRQEYPEAKIQVGGTTALRDPESYEYFFSILNSDIMPLVDAIYWIPGPGFSPDYEFWQDYYYNYPSLVENIKDVASAHGFEGEYITEGLTWCTPEMTAPGELYTYSEIVSAKYYARSIVMHLGMDVTVTGGGVDPGRAAFPTVQNLCTVMAGAGPTSLPVEIQSEAENIRSYSFSLSSGDKLIALWTDGVAVDNDPGVNANLTIQGITTQNVTGIDVLNGYQQSLTTSNENGNLVIQNLIVRDYPMILHIVKFV
jgi:hypothetical protein